MLKSLRMTAATVLMLSVMTSPVWSGIDTGQILKGAAVGIAVKQAAKPLDKFINTITFKNKLQTHMATKVVPILSVGEKGYIGGAQVSGPKNAVDKVQAVFQYEKNISNNNYRAKILLPSASLNPLALSRVAKAGVTAIIDVSLDGSLKNGTVGTGIQAGDVIKAAGLLVVIKNTGPSINKVLNTITFNKGTSTKFVPWASIGDKTYLGGAQVSASSATINSVKAVWQYDGLFAKGAFRVKVVVPTNSTNPLKMKRVDGAGITAVVDMALSEQKKPEVQKRRTNPLDSIFGIRSGNRNENQNENNTPRHDQGKHKGWIKGKHKGWDK